MKKRRKASKKNKVDIMRKICWIIVPAATAVLLVLDALEIYTFNDERLIVFGVCILVILLPFFSEITVKDLSVKRNRTGSGDGT